MRLLLQNLFRPKAKADGEHTAPPPPRLHASSNKKRLTRSATRKLGPAIVPDKLRSCSTKLHCRGESGATEVCRESTDIGPCEYK